MKKTVIAKRWLSFILAILLIAVCSGCSKEPDPVFESGSWICPACGSKNSNGTACANCPGKAEFEPKPVQFNFTKAAESVVRIVTFYTINDPDYPELAGKAGITEGSGFLFKASKNETIFVAASSHTVMHNITSGDVNMASTVIDLDGQIVYPLVQVDEIRVLFSGSEEYMTASVVEWARQADIAILKPNSPITQKALAIYDMKDIPVDEPLTAIGYPTEAEYHLDVEPAEWNSSAAGSILASTGYHAGRVAHAVTKCGNHITSDVEVTPGMSGGPLIWQDGHVVGICVYDPVTSSAYILASDELLRITANISGPYIYY